MKNEKKRKRKKKNEKGKRKKKENQIIEKREKRKLKYRDHFFQENPSLFVQEGMFFGQSRS